MKRNISFTLSDTNIKQLLNHNADLEKKIQLKVGLSLIVETIISMFFSADFPTKNNVEARICELKKQRIVDRYSRKYVVFKHDGKEVVFKVKKHANR